jgi:amidohydrolase
VPISGPLRDELVALSRGIHGEPELAYQERRAVARIAALLERHGHAVERDCGGLETAFRARIGPAGKAITLLAEYDALPELGHGCGHNLIAMSTVGAFLQAAQAGDRLDIAIELVGTPAEESGGGKLDLIDAGVFDDAVAVLSSHPGGNWWGVGQTTLGIVNLRIGFHGLAAHAAVSPEEGRNALSAAVRLFVAIDGWRQHLPSDARVHGIITNGGAAANIIPSYAEAVIGLRAADVTVLREMIATFRDLVDGCALQTGTTAEVREEMRLYEPTDSDPVLTRLLADAPEFVEGWGMYSELLMREHGFDDDPRFRLIVHTDAIWRACRIILDIRMHRGEVTVKEATDFLVEHTRFERPNARAEVQWYTYRPTYPLSYLLGRTLLLELRADEQARLGDRFSLKAFHDTLLRNGSLPISFHRRLLTPGA